MEHSDYCESFFKNDNKTNQLINHIDKTVFSDINIIFNNQQDNSVNNKISDNIFSNLKQHQHQEYQYLNLIQTIMQNGTW